MYLFLLSDSLVRHVEDEALQISSKRLMFQDNSAGDRRLRVESPWIALETASCPVPGTLALPSCCDSSNWDGFILTFSIQVYLPEIFSSHEGARSLSYGRKVRWRLWSLGRTSWKVQYTKLLALCTFQASTSTFSDLIPFFVIYTYGFYVSRKIGFGPFSLFCFTRVLWCT